MSTKPAMPPIHEYAALFPLDEGEPLWKLADDIKENGQQEPIWMLDGAILDGRRRWLACLRAGVEPKTKEYKGSNPLAFAVSKNLHRRHLGQGDRAMIAAKIATLKDGHKKNDQAASNDAADGISVTQDEAAELLNVSRKSVQRARDVLESGTPELIAAVASGEVTVSDAAAIADEPPKVQKAAVKAKKAGKAKTVKAAVKAGRKSEAVEPVDAFGTTLPKKCRDAFLDPWIQDAIDLIAQTEETFRKGRLIDGMEKRKKHYPFFTPKDFIDGCGFVMSYLDQLLSHLKDNRPAGICPACDGEGCAECRLKGIVPRDMYTRLKKAKVPA